MNEERKLSSIKKITALDYIEGADRIECATIDGGWKTVVKKGEFEVGDKCLYIEIDAWVPHKIAPFLSNGKEPREFRGVKGERLRTVKLRGQISQGLALPLSIFEDLLEFDGNLFGYDYDKVHYVDKEPLSIDSYLKIFLWEMPIKACLSGQPKGVFPSFIPKTDQERVQNLDGEIDWDDEYQITVKLDGSSMTLWKDDGIWHVASRNLELKMDQTGNTFVDTAKDIIEKLEYVLSNTMEDINGVAFQGELMGLGIQGNRERLNSHMFYLFDAWNFRKNFYRYPSSVQAFADFCGLNHVPVLCKDIKLSTIGINSIESALKFADGKSLNNPIREGVVFKRTSGERFTFKAISNEFLLRGK